MNELLQNYIEDSFGSHAPCPVKYAQFNRNYRRFFPATPGPERCLDIGIGRGEMLRCFRDWGFSNGHGIDISASAVNCCQAQGLPCELIPDTENYLRQHAQGFDIITLCDVLEHIEHDAVTGFLGAIREALKPGGTLIVQVPNMQSEVAALMFFDDFTHRCGLTEHSFGQLFAALNFADWRVYPYEAFCYGGCKEFLARILRPFFNGLTRLRRFAIGAHRPRIITPVFFAVAHR